MTIVEWATAGLELANEKGKTVDDLIVFLKNAEGVSKFFDKLFPRGHNATPGTAEGGRQMNDILIKGVELPIDSKIIMSINDKGEACAYEIGSAYPAKSYKAIVIPPHGDLIDRETVVKRLCKVGEEMIK